MAQDDQVELDSRFAATFIETFGGGPEAIDAYWWLDHPDRPGPSGRIAPDVELAAARAALYGPRREHSLEQAAEAGIRIAIERLRAARAARDSCRAFIEGLPMEAEASPIITSRPRRSGRWWIGAVAAVLVVLVIVVMAAVNGDRAEPIASPRIASPQAHADRRLAPLGLDLGGTPLGQATGHIATARLGPYVLPNGFYLVTLRCVGVGEIRLRANDGRPTSFACDPTGRSQVDRETATTPSSSRFTVTPVGEIEWSVLISSTDPLPTDRFGHLATGISVQTVLVG